MENPLRKLPSVSQLLDSAPLRGLLKTASRHVVVSGVRTFLDQLRSQMSQAVGDVRVPSPHDLAQRIASWLGDQNRPALRPTINATGVLLHTGLGRAPLAEAALDEIRLVAGGYCNLEFDLRSGRRGRRTQSVERLICQITGAEAATVVNNNAAATVLSLAALAAGREVIVSRGELVEIGGSFRLPEVMQTSGALLREVGTTNKTRLEDYRQAIGPTTAALLRVHPSNYRVVGFTERPDLDDLVALAHRHNLVLIDDIGSGALIDLTRFGLADEPLAATSIKAGADLVLFSGDKLLGGPQCGIIAGRQERVDEVARHPLFRAVRVDKLTLAALGATLRLSRDPANAEQHVPLVRMLATSLENLQQRAARLAPQLARSPLVASATVESCHSTLGGGSVPTQDIPSWAVVISPRDMTVDALAQRLRCADVPVVGRIADDRIWLDLRTVLPNQDVALVQVLESLDANSATAEREASGAAESTESGKLNKEAAG